MPDYRPGPGGQLSRRRKARHAVTTTLTMMLFLGIVAAAGWALVTNVTRSGPAARHEAAASPSAPRPTTVASPLTAADPFAGSPAESYASGAAGIVLPAARRVGRYPAAQVRHAYATVKRLLVASYLNRHTLLGGTPVALARLLIPAQRRDLDRHLGSHGKRNTRGWVTSFAPGSTQLVGNVIKVHGHMSARAATGPGSRPVLRIRADYLFVYPVQRPGLPLTRMRIVTRAVAEADFAQWDDPGGALEPWWRPQVSPAGGKCGTTDGYVHPDFPHGTPDRVRSSGAPVDPYDQSRPMPRAGCHPTTGT